MVDPTTASVSMTTKMRPKMKSRLSPSGGSVDDQRQSM
jgi:hypothetical protein